MNDIYVEDCEHVFFLEESYTLLEKSLGYKIMRKAQTNTVSLKIQLSKQKDYFENQFKQCQNKENYRSLYNWVQKQENMITRKINGKEIKNKNELKKFLVFYNDCKNRLKNRM